MEMCRMDGWLILMTDVDEEEMWKTEESGNK